LNIYSRVEAIKILNGGDIMKKLVIGFLLVSMILVPMFVSAQQGDTAVENRMMVSSLLSAFPDFLTEDIINQLRAQGYGYGEIAIISVIATQSSNNITDVINYAKENNLGWGETANYFGVKLSRIGLYINPKDEAEISGMNYLLRQRYQLSNYDIYRLRLKGLKSDEILVCYELYSRLDPKGENPELLQSIIRAREQKRDWNRIVEQVSNAGQSAQIREEAKARGKNQQQGNQQQGNQQQGNQQQGNQQQGPNNRNPK